VYLYNILANRILTGVSLDYGKPPLYEEFNHRCGIKNVVIYLTNITEESLIKNPKNQVILIPNHSLSPWKKLQIN